jgi:hypothetical protein
VSKGGFKFSMNGFQHSREEGPEMTIKPTALAALCLTVPLLLAATFHEGKQVNIVMSPDTRPCAFFSLQGVAVADPVVPSTPWFAIPKSDPGFAEKFAVLMSAKLAGKLVNVATDGTASPACGHATVLYMQIL